MNAIVAIGTSSGGLSALTRLFAGIPASFPAPICVVQHVGMHASRLPQLLAARATLPVSAAGDGIAMQAGHVYVAIPDRHLLVAGDHLHLVRGPRENHARPAIDPLFRSIAEHYGPGAIGVLLQGRLNDGTAGMFEIKRRGGVTVVQDPDDSEYPDMPQSAISHVGVDHTEPLDRMGPLLARLAAELASRPTPDLRIQPAADGTHDHPIAFVCPDCGGALRHRRIGSLEYYECHTGHRMTAEVMADLQSREFERSLEQARRIAHEQAGLAREAGLAEGLDEIAKARWSTYCREAEHRIRALEALGGEMADSLSDAAPARARRA